MKIAILLLNVGGGHMEAAKNIQHAFKEQRPDADVRIIDGLALAPGWLARGIAQSWLSIQNEKQWIWQYLYGSAFFTTRFFLWLINWFPWWGMRRELLAFNPDHVITTHLVCPPMAIKFRRVAGLSYTVNPLVTEFVLHAPTMWYPEADNYFVTSEAVREDLLARGFPGDRIHMTGIPIKKVFSEPMTKAEAREKLGLPQDAKILFLFAGTFGGTALDEIVRGNQDKGLFIAIVCGRNEETRARMEKLLAELNMPGKVYGFVDFMSVLMRACDLMIGKGGALTVSECLALGTPCIFYGSAPGNEEGNAEHQARLGFGAVANTIEETLRHVDDFLRRLPEVTEAGRRGRVHGFPRAGETLANVVLSRANRGLARYGPKATLPAGPLLPEPAMAPVAAMAPAASQATEAWSQGTEA